MFAMLMALSVLSVGCNQTTADKKAADIKKADQAETDAVNAVVEGEAKKEDIDEKTAKTVEKDEAKAEEAIEDAADADSK
jgi:hypothetical protein